MNSYCHKCCLSTLSQCLWFVILFSFVVTELENWLSIESHQTKCNNNIIMWNGKHAKQFRFNSYRLISLLVSKLFLCDFMASFFSFTVVLWLSSAKQIWIHTFSYFLFRLFSHPNLIQYFCRFFFLICFWIVFDYSKVSCKRTTL